MPETILPPITRTVVTVDLACLLCTRVSGAISEGALSVPNPEHRTSVGRFVCPYCGGRLIEGERYLVRLLRPLTAEEARPNPRGRPPKAKRPTQPPKRRMAPCQDCAKPILPQRGRTRCYACAMARIRENGLHGRLLELLRTTQPMRTVHLAAMLGCDPDVVRHVVQKARARGVPIVSVGRTYRLAGEAS